MLTCLFVVFHLLPKVPIGWLVQGQVQGTLLLYGRLVGHASACTSFRDYLWIFF